MPKKTLLSALLIVGITGSGLALAAPTEKSAQQAIAAAKAAIKKAASADGEWRDSGKFVKDAEAAVTEKDYAKAEKLAKKAEMEGDLGYKQAMAEQHAGNPSYLK